MIHMGDITKISGYDVPPADCVIGGSPCQDLSIAGKREGLAGERSGLFMEQIRIVKEMRDADRLRGRTGQSVRPRYMVWENVPGALSSNRGGDFKAVIEETIRIAEPEAADIPLPAGGKWPLADAYYGEGWSVAYRVLDAQFWGVPQRRRRIALVADFGGQSAPEILFVRESVCGNQAAVTAEGETPAAGAGRGADTAITVRIRCGCEGGGKGALIQLEKSGTLGCNNDQTLFCPQGNAVDRNVGQNGTGISLEPMFTLNATDRHAVYDARGNGDGATVPTITGDHENRVTDYMALVMATGQANAEIGRDKCPTLNCDHEAPIVFDKEVYNSGVGATGGHYISEGGPAPAQRTEHPPGVCAAGVVRRLTPLECERLQGFPDGWTDIGEWTDSKGKKRQTSDAARYKALGNSIALPPWKWVLKRLCACYERDATMASLFDGIGGFPLIWERLNGPGTCLWASEIEEFPIAVTKKRFGEAGFRGQMQNVRR